VTVIEATRGDITREQVDAIVNAANEALRGGSGVDGAIHRAAGPQLLEECRAIGACPTGEARVTSGYGLPARYVIHTVGPVWQGGRAGEPELLASCYASVLAHAQALGIRSLAFPSISTGAYGYPIADAARIAVRTVRDRVRELPKLETVRFVCFSDADLREYERALANT
jgi:O-acetyl-ADP-ribose deacetylase (regulator of RNase III)